jgi:hypothetical protein
MKKAALFLGVLGGLAFTKWQIAEGIRRCGAIDGGVFLLPVILMAGYFVQGVVKDLREIGQAPQKHHAKY